MTNWWKVVIVTQQNLGHISINLENFFMSTRGQSNLITIVLLNYIADLFFFFFESIGCYLHDHDSVASATLDTVHLST